MATPSYKHDKTKNLAQPRTSTFPAHFWNFFSDSDFRFLAEGPRLSKCVRMCPRALDLVPLTGIKLLFRRLGIKHAFRVRCGLLGSDASIPSAPDGIITAETGLALLARTTSGPRFPHHREKTSTRGVSALN